MTWLLLLLAILVALVGIALLWANPHRLTNQVFALIAAVGTFRLLFIFFAMEAGVRYAVHHDVSPVPWIKANAAITAFLPWLLWLVRESILTPRTDIIRIFLRSGSWLAIGLFLSIISITDAYIPSDSTPDNERYGYLFPWVTATTVCIYIYLAVDTWIMMRRTRGVQRIEMQFISFNLCVAALLTIMLVILGNLLDLSILRRVNLFATVAASLITAWAVTHYRIFDMRQVFVPLIRYGFLVSILYLTVSTLSAIFQPAMSEPFRTFIAVALSGSLVLILEYVSRDIFDIQGRRNLSQVRATIFDIARMESRREQLIFRFESLLCEELHCSSATLLLDDDSRNKLAISILVKRKDLKEDIGRYSWATPESVDRRRRKSQANGLQEFMVQCRLGAVVAAPRGSNVPSLVIALGQRRNDWPFTFPEIERLLNVAELMDNILTHARLSAQAALTARIEFLTMMSRGLAHDLRNLITPISSFLIHAGQNQEMDPEEAEVHAAASRSVRSMEEYVRQTLLYSEQLELRLATVDLREMFDAVRQICIDRAAARGVTLLTRCDHEPITADAVLIQRLFMNLVNNAIDASPHGRSVTLSAEPARPGWVRLTVSDHGCGIPAEHRGRIFEPYFTTKQYGGDVRGFGLGLTICKKVTELHGGVIGVSSEVGTGTTCTVELPVKPGTSVSANVPGP